ncbi:MAG TPA: helix-turn-helix domain-containing protein [Chthoniobacterales bacterium]
MIQHQHATAGADKSAVTNPEFLTIKDAARVSSLSRATLYRLIADGSIKSVSIRRRGNVSGRRLLIADSLRAFLHGEAK